MSNQQLQHLMQLIEAKQIYTSSELLQKIPADTYIPNKEKIESELQLTLQKAKILHGKMQKNRNNGNYPEAYNLLQSLYKIVPDYPNVKRDINSIATTLKKLEATISEAKIAASHGQKKEVISLLQTVRQINKNHPELSTIEKIVRKKATGKSAKSIIASVLVIVLPCLLFGFEKIMVYQAEANLNSATQQIDTYDFQEANKNIAKIHNKLRFIYVFTTIERDNLLAQATALKTSKIFTQGMRGLVLHDGKFINKHKKSIINKLAQITLKASAFTQKQEWKKALEQYTDALKLIQQNKTEVGAEDQNIRNKITALQASQQAQENIILTEKCRTIIARAHQAFEQQDWELTKEKHEEALNIATNQSIKETCIDSNSTKQFNISVTNVLLNKGDTLNDQHSPEEAASYYLKAIAHAKVSQLPPADIKAMQTKLNQLKDQAFIAQVQQLIDEGNSLVKNNEFELGLSKFNFALTMLEGNTTEAKGQKALIGSLTKKIIQTERTTIITKNIQELETSIEPTLRKYFDIAKQEKLAKCKIKFTKTKNNIYTYQITTKSLRDKTKYELFYQFNENTGKWKIMK